MTTYPGAIDVLPNPAPTDTMDVVLHAAQHFNANDAIEAIETELGTTPSGSSATVAARFGTFTADTFTGPVSFANGSAAAPSVAFASDTDTGLYRVGANSLGLSAGGAVRLTLDTAATFTGGLTLTGTSSVADRKITMQGIEMVYLPKQADFPGCVFFGSGGGSLAAGGGYNVGVGLSALASVGVGSYNTAVGHSALYAATGYSNTAVGMEALNVATGDSNTAVGQQALKSLTTGSSNVAVGAGISGITTGSGNTILGAGITGLAAASANLTLVGYQAGLSAPSTATDLVALGTVTAGSMTTPGPGVVALGSSAGRGSTNLSYSALVGHQAGMNTVLTAAQSLVAIGYQAGNGSSGDNSTLVGFQAGLSGTGAFCTAVGFQAGLNNTYADVVLLGRGAVATAVNQFVVGSASSQQTKWIPGHDTDTYLDIATANTWKVYAGGQKGIEVNATGGAPYLGFFGTAAVAKPTGVAVSAAGIHAALVTLGLIAA